jgi:hypothetical protein
MSKLLRRGRKAPWRPAVVAAFASFVVVAVIGWVAGTAVAAVVFTDDFEDGNSSGWTTSGGGTWAVASDGTQVLRTSGAAAADSKALAGSSWTDYALQARVKPVSFDGTNRFVGIAARVQDDLNYYYIALRSNNTAELKKLVAGAPTTLGSISLTVAAGTWYTTRLQVTGSTVTGSVNGTQIASVADTQFSAGRIGALTYSASASFDDVTVDTVAAPTTPPTPPTSPPPTSGSGKQMEDLNRGLISVRSGSGNLVSWRLFGYESPSTAFNVYRGSTKVNATPITTSTNYLDSGAAADASYTVRAVVNGAEQGASETSLRFAGGGYLDVPISAPASGYVANDASVGDLDGDGQYEIVFKWERATRDNSQSGVTDPVYLDAVRLNGQRMWRVNLGINIRAGAHYTQFQVYDYDGDGRAEVAV